MANKTAILSVKIISDASDFKKGTDSATAKLDKFQQKMSKLTVPATAVLGGLAVIGKGFFDAASAAQQSMGTVESTFGAASQQVVEYAKTAADRLGVSKREYYDYASSLGTSLEAAGVPLKDLAAETDKQLTAIGDIAAAKGKTVAQASDAVISAYRGEYDSLQNLGISINDSIVMERLKEKGLDKLTGTALAQAKAQEVSNIVMENGTKFQGQFNKESDTAAQRQQKLTAQFENLSSELGEKLLPYVSAFVEILKDVIDWVTQNIEFVQVLAVVIGVLAGAFIVLNTVLAIMNILAAVNPLGFFIIAVSVLIGVLVYVATQTTFFQDTWKIMCQVVTDVWNGFVGFFIDLWNGAVGFFNDTLANIGKFFSDTFSNVSSFVGGVLNGIVDGFNNVVGAVQNAINWVSNLFNGFSIPGWMRDVMGFMGMGGTGFEIAMGYNLTGLEAGTGATGPFGFTPNNNSGSAPVINNNYSYTINMSGIIDQESAGREIERVLSRHSRNSGSRPAAGGFTS